MCRPHPNGQNLAKPRGAHSGCASLPGRVVIAYGSANHTRKGTRCSHSGSSAVWARCSSSRCSSEMSSRGCSTASRGSPADCSPRRPSVASPRLRPAGGTVMAATDLGVGPAALIGVVAGALMAAFAALTGPCTTLRPTARRAPGPHRRGRRRGHRHCCRLLRGDRRSGRGPPSEAQRPRGRADHVWRGRGHHPVPVGDLGPCQADARLSHPSTLTDPRPDPLKAGETPCLRTSSRCSP